MAKRSGDDGDDGAAALGKKLKMDSDQEDPNPDPQQN